MSFRQMTRHHQPMDRNLSQLLKDCRRKYEKLRYLHIFFIFLAVYCNIRISVSDISFTVPQTGILYTKQNSVKIQILQRFYYSMEVV